MRESPLSGSVGPVVLVHGAAEDSRIWHPHFGGLADALRWRWRSDQILQEAVIRVSGR